MTAPLRRLKWCALLIGLLPFAGLAHGQSSPLPDWSHAGYRGNGVLPTESDITTDAACIITPDALADTYHVIPNDGVDDSAGLQSAIDAIRGHCAGSFSHLSLIELPSGTLNTSTEIHVDASFLILRGQGSSAAAATQIVFSPDDNTIYDDVAAPDFDLGAMTGQGTANGGWIWPGRGAFRVQTRAIDRSYENDYRKAAPNRRDFFEGSVNDHWKAGVAVTEDSFTGDTTITVKNARTIHVGDAIWVGAPNTAKMYTDQGVERKNWVATEFMRQQMFTVTAIDDDTLTLDKPLEFDLPHNSTADGSEPIDGTVRPAKVVPLTVVQGVGFEDFALTQTLPGHDPSEAVHNYTNIDPLRALNGIVFKWATDSYVRGVATSMTGSHAIVTEMARHIQIEDSTFDGAWNKGAGGTGYFRLSKVWDSLVQGNTLRNLRHLAVQWSASGNVIQNNDLDADIDLHGGWERDNLFQNNTVRVPYDHRACSPHCGPNDETWYPIWWGSGEHAGDWAGASGPRNVFYHNTLQKQLTPDGPYTDYAPYGTNPSTIFMIGWDNDTASGSHWVHLSIGGVPIATWTGQETVDFSRAPNAGVNAQCTSESPSLVGGAVTCTEP